jgi:hypothetical protein
LLLSMRKGAALRCWHRVEQLLDFSSTQKSPRTHMGHLAAAAELIEKEAVSIASSAALGESTKTTATRSARLAPDEENQSHTSDSSDAAPVDQTAPTAPEPLPPPPPPHPEPLDAPDDELKQTAPENGVWFVAMCSTDVSVLYL